jgi:hypothetical protein
MFVRAWLIPANLPGYYHMRVEMFTPDSVPGAVRVRLYWDNHEYYGVVRPNQVFFEDITPPDFSRHAGNLPSRRMRLTFEFPYTEPPRAPKGKSSSNGNH